MNDLNHLMVRLFAATERTVCAENTSLLHTIPIFGNLLRAHSFDRLEFTDRARLLLADSIEDLNVYEYHVRG